jgi:hypothetical protein
MIMKKNPALDHADAVKEALSMMETEMNSSPET